jgi:predicted Zn-dependent protease with MMP-like domain
MDGPIDDPAFEDLVVAALDALPDEFRQQLGTVAIVIEEEPDPAQLRALGVHGLYGLYEGVPRTAYGASNTAYASKITLFRGPLTRAHRTPGGLATAVTDTVHHEIAHHLGIGDARLRELRSSDRGRGGAR